MNFRYDRILLDPPPGLVGYVLREAADAANEKWRAGCCYPMTETEACSTPEGRTCVTGFIEPGKETGMIGLAWWTDRGGRKHVRICSGRTRVRDERARPLFPPDWPPIRCVHPTAAHRPGHRGPSVACDCGRRVAIDDLTRFHRLCRLCRDRREYEEDTGFQQYEGARR